MTRTQALILVVHANLAKTAKSEEERAQHAQRYADLSARAGRPQPRPEKPA